MGLGARSHCLEAFEAPRGTTLLRMEYYLLLSVLCTDHVSCPHPSTVACESKNFILAVTEEFLEQTKNPFGLQELRLINQINRAMSSNLILNYPHPFIHDPLPT